MRYESHIHGEGYRFAFNGKPIERVLMADEEFGRMIILQTDLEGHVIPNPDMPFGFETLVLQGEVKVTAPPPRCSAEIHLSEGCEILQFGGETPYGEPPAELRFSSYIDKNWKLLLQVPEGFEETVEFREVEGIAFHALARALAEEENRIIKAMGISPAMLPDPEKEGLRKALLRRWGCLPPPRTMIEPPRNRMPPPPFGDSD